MDYGMSDVETGRKYQPRQFSDVEIKNIRSEYLSGSSMRELARSYDVDVKTISNIVWLNTYKWVEVDDAYLPKLNERVGR